MQLITVLFLCTFLIQNKKMKKISLLKALGLGHSFPMLKNVRYYLIDTTHIYLMTSVLAF